VVIGQEATGRNEFISRVGATLAALGHATIVPDYFHGDAPPDPENYEDIETIVSYLAKLDFRRGAYDLVEGLRYLKALPEVDPRRVAVWGYCTGATMALLAACLRSDVAASVLFYPSQPRFDVLNALKPVHPIDMLWNLSSPVLLLVGEADGVWPPELVSDVRERLDRWGVDHTITRLPGAGHAFCSPSPMFHHPEAEAVAWREAVAFLTTRLAAAQTRAPND